MFKETEAQYAIRRESEELELAISSPLSSVAAAHYALAREYRLRVEAMEAATQLQGAPTA